MKMIINYSDKIIKHIQECGKEHGLTVVEVDQPLTYMDKNNRRMFVKDMSVFLPYLPRDLKEPYMLVNNNYELTREFVANFSGAPVVPIFFKTFGKFDPTSFPMDWYDYLISYINHKPFDYDGYFKLTRCSVHRHQDPSNPFETDNDWYWYIHPGPKWKQVNPFYEPPTEEASTDVIETNAVQEPEPEPEPEETIEIDIIPEPGPVEEEKATKSKRKK